MHCKTKINSRMLSIIVASHFMLAYPADVLPNSEISNVHFFRKKTEITNGNCKRTPAVPVSSLHADVTNNRIILNFEDEEFSDIDVTDLIQIYFTPL